MKAIVRLDRKHKSFRPYKTMHIALWLSLSIGIVCVQLCIDGTIAVMAYVRDRIENAYCIVIDSWRT